MSLTKQLALACIGSIMLCLACMQPNARFLLTPYTRQIIADVSARRLFAYDDAQRYRIGPNFALLPVNRPRCPFFNNQQDGPMNSADQKGEINYYPSSFAKQVLLKAACSALHAKAVRMSAHIALSLT